MNNHDLEPGCPARNPSRYETSDLYLSAFLRARGISLTGVRRAGNRIFFVFEGSGDFDRLVQEFFADGAIGILSVKSALRDLHAIIRGDIMLDSSEDSDDRR